MGYNCNMSDTHFDSRPSWVIEEEVRRQKQNAHEFEEIKFLFDGSFQLPEMRVGEATPSPEDIVEYYGFLDGCRSARALGELAAQRTFIFR